MRGGQTIAALCDPPDDGGALFGGGSTLPGSPVRNFRLSLVTTQGADESTAPVQPQATALPELLLPGGGHLGSALPAGGGGIRVLGGGSCAIEPLAEPPADLSAAVEGLGAMLMARLDALEANLGGRLDRLEARLDALLK